jgi:hypothetical protein
VSFRAQSDQWLPTVEVGDHTCSKLAICACVEANSKSSEQLTSSLSQSALVWVEVNPPFWMVLREDLKRMRRIADIGYKNGIIGTKVIAILPGTAHILLSFTAHWTVAYAPSKMEGQSACIS